MIRKEPAHPGWMALRRMSRLFPYAGWRVNAWCSFSGEDVEDRPDDVTDRIEQSTEPSFRTFPLTHSGPLVVASSGAAGLPSSDSRYNLF